MDILDLKVKEDQYFEMHFYRMTIYSKLQSLITSMVADVIMGVIMLFVIEYYTKEILDILHYFGQIFHIEVLKR
jgi:hypothetical protein